MQREKEKQQFTSVCASKDASSIPAWCLRSAKPAIF